MRRGLRFDLILGYALATCGMGIGGSDCAEKNRDEGERRETKSKAD